MKELRCDVLVIGSGPAGLAAAARARETGAGCVLVIERNREPGGILNQCIHNGFGLSYFGTDLTGPEYAARWQAQAAQAGVDWLLDTMVLEVGADRHVIAANSQQGLVRIEPKALVLAMGCRERPRGALAIPGTRPAGVYTAGTAQRLVNIEGYMPGRRFVILGSGDIGMIMARRLTLEGAEVVAMVEILPYISGLRRNLVQCVRDFGIPLHLCTTITAVRGRERVEAVEISQVDTHWRPIEGTQEEIACDTLLLSVGLVPENELSRMAGVALDPVTGGPIVNECLATGVPGIYAAGNVVHVYDLVDEVTRCALLAGQSAAERALRGDEVSWERALPVQAGNNVRHVVPQRLSADTLRQSEARIELRVREPIEAPVRVEIYQGERLLKARRLRYARPSEMIAVPLDGAARSTLTGSEPLRITVRQEQDAACDHLQEDE
jgi:NADPH-dependent 2,4-dienoyl-CoA reductase/sulfur reductase-like enzyme